MSNLIHPTAIIHPTADIGHNNYIGPYCLIGPGVKMGNGNRLEAYASIGTAAEHRDYFRKEAGDVQIGNNCVIREFVTINAGTSKPTIVGSNVTLLKGAHVGHDAIIRDKAHLSCNVLIGGHSIIGEGCNLGLAVAVHQMRVVGAFTMLGMNSAVTKNIAPFVIAYGIPASIKRINRIGLNRSGLNDQDISLFEKCFEHVGDNGEGFSNLPKGYEKYLNTFTQDCLQFEVLKNAA